MVQLVIHIVGFGTIDYNKMYLTIPIAHVLQVDSWTINTKTTLAAETAWGTTLIFVYNLYQLLHMLSNNYSYLIIVYHQISWNLTNIKQ